MENMNMKKIIGLSCGKINGNCETLLKSAAMGAAELSVDTEIIRAMELRVLPCKGCHACFKTKKCVQDDDIEWILEKTMVEDAGLILSIPTYHLRSNAYMACITDKILHVFRNLNQHEMNVINKTRVGGIIGVGGSGYDAWASLNLTTANIFLQHTRILVDQIQVNQCGLREWNLWLQNKALPQGHTSQVRCQDIDYDKVWELWNEDNDPVDFTRESLARARQLGRNVAAAMSLPVEKVKYVGEEYAVACPVCHCNVLVIPEDLPHVGCPVCWVRGMVKTENGNMKVEWNMDDVRNPRYSAGGQEHHWHWLTSHAEKRAVVKKEISELSEGFKNYGRIIRPENNI